LGRSQSKSQAQPESRSFENSETVESEDEENIPEDPTTNITKKSKQDTQGIYLDWIPGCITLLICLRKH